MATEEYIVSLGALIDEGAVESINTQIKTMQPKLDKVRISIDEMYFNKQLTNIQNQLNRLFKDSDFGKYLSSNLKTVSQEISKTVNDTERQAKRLTDTLRTGFVKYAGLSDGTKDNTLIDETKIQKAAQTYFNEINQIGNVTTKVFRNADSEIESFTIDVKNAEGIIEQLRYTLHTIEDEEGNITNAWYAFSNAVGSDNNIKLQEEAIRKATQANKEHEAQMRKNEATSIKLQASLDGLKKEYEDLNSARPIRNKDSLKDLGDKYTQITGTVTDLKIAEKDKYAVAKANIESQIKSLKLLIEAYRKAENSGTQLRTKPVEVSKIDEEFKLDAYIAKMQRAGIVAQEFWHKINGVNADGTANQNSLKSKLEAITDTDSLNAYLNLLSNVQAEGKKLIEEKRVNDQQAAQSQKQVNKAIEEYESVFNRLRNANISLAKLDSDKNTGQIQQLTKEIQDLEKEETDAFTKLEQFVGWWKATEVQDEKFDKLKKDLQDINIQLSDKSAWEQQKQAEKEAAAEYKQLISTIKEIGSLQSKITGLTKEEDVNIVANLNRQLSETKGKAVELSNVLEGKLSASQIKEIEYEWEKVGNSIDLANAKVQKSEALKQKKVDVKEVNKAFQEMLSLQSQIGSVEKSMVGLDTNNPKYKELSQQLLELKTGYDSLYQSYSKKLSTQQIDNLANGFLQISKNIKVANAELEKSNIDKKFNELKNVSKEIGSLQKNIAGLGSNTNDKEINSLSSRLEELFGHYERLKNELNGKLTAEQFKELNEITRQVNSQLEVTKSKIFDIAKVNIANGNISNDIKKLESDFNSLNVESIDVSNNINRLKTLMGNMGTSDDIESVKTDYQEYNVLLQTTINQVKELQRNQKQANANQALQNSRLALSSQIDVWLKNNSAAAKQFGAQLKEIQSQIATADKTQLRNLRAEFQEVTRQAAIAGQTGKTMAEQFKQSLRTVTSYFSAAALITRMVSTMRNMYNEVLKVDTAMTGLKRVTSLTNDEYTKMYNDMTDSAKKYGSTLSDIIDLTTSWVKLGFDSNTAERLAEISTMYQHVADIDTATATENLVSTYKGFQKSLDETFGGDTTKAVEYLADIFDKLNNEYAVTAADVGAALQRSASSLQFANNTLQESSALVVGMNEVLQDASKTGTILNTTALRLMGAKGKLEELGEEVDENIESVTKLQTHILNLTHGQVNIFNDDQTFKSTYQILKEISAIYDKLSDVEQADLLESIAGRFYLNVQRCA